MSNELQKTQGFNLTPSSLDEAMKYAKLIADSDLAPKDYKGKPGNVLVAMQMGAEVGLKPMQALQNIAVINGRPSLWGDAMLAIVKVHPEFESINECFDNSVAHCTVNRRGQEPQTQTFSMEDAKKAGLAGKAGPWTQYPQRMLQMRARGFCLRDTFPDALKGLHMAEESMDLPKEDYKVTVVQEANKQIGADIPKGIQWDVIFSRCLTLEELKIQFDRNKPTLKSPKEILAFTKAKDDRKKELESEVLANQEIPIIEQSVDDWVEEYDNAEKK